MIGFLPGSRPWAVASSHSAAGTAVSAHSTDCVTSLGVPLFSHMGSKRNRASWLLFLVSRA
eukprot:COSAG06_NODE_1288_length_9990_cov_17.463351_4_plen_61_part_00